MSSTLAGLMEALVLDPAKNREFTADPERALAGLGLIAEERRALASGDVSVISRMLDGEGRYARGAIILLILFREEEDQACSRTAAVRM